MHPAASEVKCQLAVRIFTSRVWETHSFREFGEHDGRSLIGWSSGETLPKFFGDERHEGMKETESVVKHGVESVLSRETSFGIGSRISDELDRFLSTRDCASEVDQRTA